MKKLASMLFAILIAASIGAPIVSAQEPSSKEEVMAKVQQMATALQLTPEQMQKIKPIIMQEAPKIKAVKDDTTLSQMQKIAKMRKLSDGVNAQIKPILTPDQFQKLQEIRMQQRDQAMQQK